MNDQKKSTKFLEERLNLPLFMISRKSLQPPAKLNQVKQHLNKHITLLVNDCQADKSPTNKTQQKLLNIIGTESSPAVGACQPKLKATERNATIHKSWQLPANRYDTSIQPFQSKAGLSGAYWRKLEENKSRINKTQLTGSFVFYDVARDMDKFRGRCHLYKNKFLSNARENRPYSRHMTSNPLSCYRDPKSPGPATYSPSIDLSKPKINLSLCDDNPHKFLRHSIVPEKQSCICRPNIHFEPTVGRYETRFPHTCPCVYVNRTYQPDILELIDKQKRLRFRRLPYIKIKASDYCSPNYRHIIGNGFRRLFKKPKNFINAKPIKSKQEVNKDKQLKLFADAKYLQIINNTKKRVDTIRSEPLPEIPKKIVYNAMIKLTGKRKHLKQNKKLAFGSAAERFKGMESYETAKKRDVSKLKQKIHNYPIMTKRKSQIVSRLENTPKHMQVQYIPKLRKGNFKFSPLPKSRILVTQSDTQPAVADVKDAGYFYRPYDPKTLFKDTSVQRSNVPATAE